VRHIATRLDSHYHKSSRLMQREWKACLHPQDKFSRKTNLLLPVTYRWVRNRLLRSSERKTMARCYTSPLVSQFNVSVTETLEFPSRYQSHHNTTLKINHIIRIIQPSCLHLVLRMLLWPCETEIWDPDRTLCVFKFPDQSWMWSFFSPSSSLYGLCYSPGG
jgi:hypothetical protein